MTHFRDHHRHNEGEAPPEVSSERESQVGGAPRTDDRDGVPADAPRGVGSAQDYDTPHPTVDGAPRGHHHQTGHAPPDVARDDEVNVGGAPRTEHHLPGHGPNKVADEAETNVGGAPRRHDED